MSCPDGAGIAARLFMAKPIQKCEDHMETCLEIQALVDKHWCKQVQKREDHAETRLEIQALVVKHWCRAVQKCEDDAKTCLEVQALVQAPSKNARTTQKRVSKSKRLWQAVVHNDENA